MPSAEVVDVMFTFLQTVEALTQWGRISFLPLPPYYYPFILLYLPVTYSLVFSLPLILSYSPSLLLYLTYLLFCLSHGTSYTLFYSPYCSLSPSHTSSLSLSLILPSYSLSLSRSLFSPCLSLLFSLYLGSRWHK